MRLDVAKITSLLREKIGTMEPGDSLPGIRTLMKEYGVSQSLIQQAYMTLKQDELIESHDGSGTYVTEKGGLRKILWVCGIDIFHGDISPYFSHVLRYCKRTCAEHGLSLDHAWLSNYRPEDSESYCTPEILERYEGFIFCGCAEKHLFANYVYKNHAPFSMMTHYLSRFPNRVVEDSPNLLTAGFLYLKNKGHNNVIYIDNEDSTYDAIRYNSALKAGVKIRQLCYSHELWTVDTERQAYLNMCREIKENGLPKAIFIKDDIAAKGATRAIIELCDCKEKEALDIIIYCSLQTIMPLGLKTAYLITDIKDAVESTVDILCAQLSDYNHVYEDVIVEKYKLMTDI